MMTTLQSIQCSPWEREAELERVTAQRDALAQALRSVIKAADREQIRANPHYLSRMRAVMANARAALAKLPGNPK